MMRTTLFFKHFFLLTAILLSGIINGTAQTNSSQLDNYIDTAMIQNQGLKEQQFNLDKAIYALKEAKAMFLPTVGLSENFTKSAGGRVINVPFGNMLNPVYTTLNQLTNSTKFPQIANQTFNLNPALYYDTKVRTSLSLINSEIWYNKEIKKQLITSQQAAVNVYKRELVKDIKIAYYRYYQSLQSIATYQSSAQLIKENIRENESMLKNGLRNVTALLRAQTEQQKTNALIIQASHSTRNAKSYFNFLLNRSLQDTILVDNETITQIVSTADTTAGTGKREELKQLQSMKEVYTLNYKLEKAGIIPKVSSFIDLGTQGASLSLGSSDRYYLLGINLQWDIFTGGVRKYRAKQYQASAYATNAQLDQTRQSLQLELDQTFNNFQSASAAYRSVIAQITFATKYYNDQMKAYRAGQLIYLELIDAQDQLTSARLQLADAKANLQISLAELERSQATYPINK